MCLCGAGRKPEERRKMTQTEIRKALERFTGSPFIKSSELAVYVKDKNISRVKQRYLTGLECLPGKLYLCSEVAGRIKESCRIE